jgi:hypothetical protein
MSVARSPPVRLRAPAEAVPAFRILRDRPGRAKDRVVLVEEGIPFSCARGQCIRLVDVGTIRGKREVAVLCQMMRVVDDR